MLDKDISAFTKISLDEGNKYVKSITKSTMDRIVNNTPYRTGKLRNNWVASRVSPNFSGERNPDISGTDALSEIETTIKNYKKSDWGESLWLVNKVEYADFIEKGGSGQAPAGMMRRQTLNAVKDF